jgi:hypothetical protein
VTIRIRAARLLLGLACFAPFPAARAAANPLEPPDLGRYLKWGPLRVRPGFAIPALGYDDNVLGSTESSQQQIGAFGIRLSPRVEGVVLMGGLGFLTFRERVDYTAYAGYSDLNYTEHQGSYRLTVPFRRLGFYGDFANNRLKDPPLSEIDTRPVREEIRVGAGIILRLGWRTDAEIGLVRSDWTVTDPDYVSSTGLTIGDLQDRVESGRQLRVRYRLTGLTSVTLDTSNRDIVFDNPTVERDATETVIAPGFQFGENGRIAGSVRIGAAWIDAEKETVPDLSTPVGDVKIAFRMSSVTSFRIEGQRRAAFSIYEGNRYYIQSLYEGRIVHFLNRVFGIEAAAAAGLLTYPEVEQASAREDSNRRYEAGVRFRLPESALGRQTDYTLFVRRWRRDSSIDSLDQSRTIVGIAANVGF